MSNLLDSLPLVHYVYDNDPLGCQPAIVTGEFSEYCRPADLAVFMANSLRYRCNVGYDSATNVPGTWHRLSDHDGTKPAEGQLEELAAAIVVNAWNRASDLSVLREKIQALVGVARRAAPPSVLPS